MFFDFFVREWASPCNGVHPATRTVMCHRCGTKADTSTRNTTTTRTINDNKGGFQHSSSRNNCTFDARLVSKTRKYQQTNILRFVRMTFVYRLTFHTQKKRHVHISQSVNRSKLVSSVSRFLSNQSSAPARSNAFRSIHPGRQSDQLLSCTNTAKS